MKAEIERLRTVIQNAIRVLIDHDLDGTIWYDQHTTLAEYLRMSSMVCPLLRGEKPLFPEADTISDSTLVDLLTLELDKARGRIRDLECKVERMESGLTLEDAQQISDALDRELAS